MKNTKDIMVDLVSDIGLTDVTYDYIELVKFRKYRIFSNNYNKKISFVNKGVHFREVIENRTFELGNIIKSYKVDISDNKQIENNSLLSVMRARKSDRKYQNKITKRELIQLLSVSYNYNNQNKKWNIASGGGTYPIEVFFINAKIEGIERLSGEEIEEILSIVQEKITEMFFDEVHFGKFQYQLTAVLNFKQANKEFYLVNESRKVELKERFDRYVQETTIDGSRKVIENEWISFLDKLFDTNLTQYTESQIIAVAEKYMKSIETMGDKKYLKEYRSSLIHRAGKWKKAVFMPLYYQVKGNEKWDKEYNNRDIYSTRRKDFFRT